MYVPEHAVCHVWVALYVKASLIEFIFRKRILLEFSHPPDTSTIIFVTLSEVVETG